VSEEYRRVQYVSVTDPLFPKLHGRALPVSRWTLSDHDEIQGVFVMIGNHELYFARWQFKCYRSGDDQILLVTQQHTASIFAQLKKFFTTPHQR
jgi:hypothetical protein